MKEYISVSIRGERTVAGPEAKVIKHTIECVLKGMKVDIIHSEVLIDKEDGN